MLTVVHLHFHGRRTGVTSHTENIVAAQNELGTSTYWFGYGPLDEKYRIGVGSLSQLLRKNTFVFHTHRNPELIFALVCRFFFRKIRIVSTCHSPRIASRFTQWLSKKSNALVMLNSDLSRAMPCQNTIIRHGVNLKKFQPPAVRPQNLGIGVVGRIRPNKGQGDFVEAILPLLEKYREWTPVLIGLVQPEFKSWVDSLVEKTKGRLLVLPEQRDIEKVYQTLSIVVHPSWGEAFSMVTLEAMAVGAAVVATKLCDVDLIVKHGETGFLYTPKDVEALKQLLSALMEKPSEIARLGDAAANFARSHLGVEVEAKALIELYGAEPSHF